MNVRRKRYTTNGSESEPSLWGQHVKDQVLRQIPRWKGCQHSFRRAWDRGWHITRVSTGRAKVRGVKKSLGRLLVYVQPIIGQEEEALVTAVVDPRDHDRRPYCHSRVILIVVCGANSIQLRRRNPICSVERIATKIIVNPTVDSICSRTRYKAKLPARCPAVFCRICRTEYTKFLQGFHRDKALRCSQSSQT